MGSTVRYRIRSLPAGETNVVLSLLGRERGNETVRTTTTTDARSRGKGWVVEGKVTDSRDRVYLRKG
jgi:hypothetical protein